MGFKLPLNFNVPYSALSLTDFWKRWHISLSSWLRDYLYIPLGGNKKGIFRTYLNLFITMLLGGLWHGASWKFVVWGGLHGFMLAIERMLKKVFPKPNTSFVGKRIAWLYTFHLVAFCWIFFRAANFEQAISVIHQIGNSFHPELFITILSAYPEVFSGIAIGYLLHWTPRKIDQAIESGFIKMPLWLQSLMLALIIWLTFQTLSANVQPFIYFQF
jgi:D-alanyl-lipoteichoic acid acyltransferase DltB (MBOAT superfamily)